MSSDLAIREQLPGPLAIGALRLNGLDDLARVAQAVAASGMFKDANTPEKVAVKMFFALTMGFSPIAGLTGVDIISGNPTPNAHFWAAAIEDSPLYDYDVKERTNERCTVVFSRWDERKGEWRKRGEITWTIEDAKRAKLSGKDVWTQYPRAMLWARCMTEGGRTYCPGLFGGVRAYDPEELGGTPTVQGPYLGEPRPLIDGLTGEVIEVPVVEQEAEPAAVGDPAPVEEEVEQDADAPDSEQFLISEKQRRLIFAKGKGLTQARIREIVLELTKQEHTTAITVAQFDQVLETVEHYAKEAAKEAALTEALGDDPPETSDNQTLLPSEVIAQRRSAAGDA